MTNIESPGFRIEALDLSHDRRTFSCGVDSLNRYFRVQAGQEPRKNIAATFVLVGPNGQVAGYYTLSAEFTFRFNRRRSKARGLLFHRLAQQALAAGPAPYNAIVKPAGSSGSPTTGQ